MAEAKIVSCTCNSEFQDKLYGKGKRVANPYGKTQEAGYRCTVCGKESGSGSVKKK